jgi:ABC-type branched-subunit amino acid transport system substrate-binding protein
VTGDSLSEVEMIILPRSIRTSRRFFAVAASIVLLAGCSSDGGAADDATGSSAPGSSTGSSSAPTVTRGVTDTAITVGGLTTIEGPGFNWGDTCTGAKVVFDKVNAAGGVAGRKINFTECIDDKNDPSLNTSGARKLTTSDQVFAVVPGQSLAFAGSSILQSSNTPYFGWGTNPYFCGPEQGFGFNGCTAPDEFAAWGKLITIAEPSAKRIAIQGLNIPAGIQATDALAAGAEANGLEVVYKNAAMPLQVNDYSPFIQKIIAAKPDHVIVATADPITMLNDLTAAGFKGTTTNAGTYDPAILENPVAARALEGQYVDIQTQPFESDEPAVAQFKQDVATYGPADQPFTAQLSQGYASALLFVAILKEVGQDLTYASFYEVANGGDFCWSGEGFVGEICYPQGHTEYSNCEALVKVTDGKFAAAAPITCAKPSS